MMVPLAGNYDFVAPCALDASPTPIVLPRRRRRVKSLENSRHKAASPSAAMAAARAGGGRYNNFCIVSRRHPISCNSGKRFPQTNAAALYSGATDTTAVGIACHTRRQPGNMAISATTTERETNGVVGNGQEAETDEKLHLIDDDFDETLDSRDDVYVQEAPAPNPPTPPQPRRGTYYRGDMGVLDVCGADLDRTWEGAVLPRDPRLCEQPPGTPITIRSYSAGVAADRRGAERREARKSPLPVISGAARTAATSTVTATAATTSLAATSTGLRKPVRVVDLSSASSSSLSPPPPAPSRTVHCVIPPSAQGAHDGDVASSALCLATDGDDSTTQKGGRTTTHDGSRNKNSQNAASSNFFPVRPLGNPVTMRGLGRKRVVLRAAKGRSNVQVVVSGVRSATGDRRLVRRGDRGSL